jgi:hypothetical protein
MSNVTPSRARTAPFELGYDLETAWKETAGMRREGAGF